MPKEKPELADYCYHFGDGLHVAIGGFDGLG